MMAPHVNVLFAVLLFLGTTEAAKILVIHAFPGRSHVVAYQPLYHELARRGHQVTMVSAFPSNKKIPNYTEIALENPISANNPRAMNFFERRNIPKIFMGFVMKKVMIDSCENVLAQPAMQELIHSTDLQFDLIIYEPFATQCIYGLFHKFKAPTIQVLPNTLISWNYDPAGNPSTASYIPNLFAKNEDMDFLSKLLNFGLEMYMMFFSNFILEPQMESIMRKYFNDPNLPSVRELVQNTSFVFLHSHPIIHHPRPLTPNTIEVGGLHLSSSQKLPEDLQKFMDDAPHGVIYFSLGSNVRSIDMPETMLNAILKSFSKLKQKVLWKWENDTLPGQPKNVKLGKWLPQQPILAHPNVKLFMTHGGLMSLQELTYFGIPVIAIPVAADQQFNAAVAQNRGFGVFLEINNITEASLDWALREVLEEPRYREAVQRASKIFRDQPQTPLERAIFWIEFCLRHQGAGHLRSAALQLNTFQYYLLDVILVLTVLTAASVYLTVFIARRVIKKLFSKKVSFQKKKN